MPPLAEGWLLVHWAYGGVQRQKHRFDVDNGIFIWLDLGMAHEDSQILALKALWIHTAIVTLFIFSCSQTDDLDKIPLAHVWK